MRHIERARAASTGQINPELNRNARFHNGLIIRQFAADFGFDVAVKAYLTGTAQAEIDMDLTTFPDKLKDSKGNKPTAFVRKLTPQEHRDLGV